MNKGIQYVKFAFNLVRCSPHFVVFLFHKNKPLIRADLKQWAEVLQINYSEFVTFFLLLGFHKAFRNIFYFRIGPIHHILNLFCWQISSLVIGTKNIGGGLYIWHGFSTAIGAKSIGKNCMINHQVTIGNKDGNPIILDNVRIHPGAIIFGEITIGNNVVIGANTTVYEDIPDNCSVFVKSSKVMHWHNADRLNHRK